MQIKGIGIPRSRSLERGAAELIREARRLGSQKVIETLAGVMVVRGIPEYLRPDNGLTCKSRVSEI